MMQSLDSPSDADASGPTTDSSASTPGLAPGDALLARAFQAAPNGFVMVDRRGRIVAANVELAAMFGYPDGGMTGLALEALLPDALVEAHRHLREGFFERPERRVMGVGRVLYAKHADGHQFPVEIGLNPVQGEAEMLVLASVVDISERVALEGAFRRLFDTSPFGLAIVNDDGTIELSNQVLANSLGYSPADLAGQPLEVLLTERNRGAHAGLMAGYFPSGQSRLMGRGRDLTALHRDGTEVAVEIGLSRVDFQGRKVTLAAVNDISARKRMELDLRQANANLEEFTHVASHDLRSPLRGVADLLEWIREDLGSDVPAVVQKNFDRVSLRVLRMERLIDDLLRYARMGRQSTDYTAIGIGRVLQSIQELQPFPGGFRLSLDLHVPEFQAALVPLETVLRNLLSNAIKHHDKAQGLIRVSAYPVGDYCEVCITDDGPGIPQEAQQRVFKLFQTLLPKSESGSTGMGLALTKRLVEVHGGQIELKSPISEGRGCSFICRWPRFPRRSNDGPESQTEHIADRGR